jgi:hypothetical protein
MACVLWAGCAAATAKDASPGAPTARRFAFAISGGASLGAYEAGINWGSLTLLQRYPQRGSVGGGRLRPLVPAGFAGASAGSINALMSAMTWCVRPEADGGFPNRIDDNLFRNLWFLPDVNTLLPQQPDAASYRADDALLSRASLLQAAEVLRQRWRAPVFRAGCRVPIGVTLTRVHPENLRVENVDVQNQRFYIPFELRARPDGRGEFTFDPANYPTLVDLAMILLPRAAGTAPTLIDEERMMEAVLTSAAFPVAFGRKRLQYCRLTSTLTATERPEEEGAAAPAAEAPGLHCPGNYELAEAEFADGGLFDNLPIGLARNLSLHDRRAAANPLPALYIYLEPDRTRYATPKPVLGSACTSATPPPACRQLDYSLTSESQLLWGAMGTARKYELYRELTSEYWTLGLPTLATTLADRLEETRSSVDCREALPFFDDALSCPEALRASARLLELSYGRAAFPLTRPYSAAKLRAVGIAQDCESGAPAAAARAAGVCAVDPVRLRERLGEAMVTAMQRAQWTRDPLMRRIVAARASMRNDRALRVTSRGAPLTGSLLSSFGAFLDLKFREYDYYVGVYDAVVAISQALCQQQFDDRAAPDAQRSCVEASSREFYVQLGVDRDSRARYVFARLARAEFGERGALRFAYEPWPAEDRDMRIIHEGLERALIAGALDPKVAQSSLPVEMEFFNYLRSQAFVPTPTREGDKPLLATIMADPEAWSAELTRRAASRLVYLEQRADKIFAAREPDPDKREQSMLGLLGATTHVLLTATQQYPSYSFAPSTAPSGWWGRYVIPYEVGFDLMAGDALLFWEPTWSLSRKYLLSLRTGVGFAGGFVGTQQAEHSQDYVSVSTSLTRLTGRQIWSSWGASVGWYEGLGAADGDPLSSAGADLHVSFFKDRLRLAVGNRDVGHAEGQWFFLLGLTDIPGLTYWLTR